MRSTERLVERAVALASRPGRSLLGIAGAPGAGKTTAALWLVSSLRARGISAAHVPMDGFHLADAALDSRGALGRKGAIDTFDGHGYLALLDRLRTDAEATVWAPDFDRAIEQPIAGSIPIDPDVTIVISEGNYLLSGENPWPRVRAAFDEVWFAEVEHAERVERLIARHVLFGKTPEQAREWVERIDEPNARSIETTRGDADLVVDVDQLPVVSS